MNDPIVTPVVRDGKLVAEHTVVENAHWTDETTVVYDFFSWIAPLTDGVRESRWARLRQRLRLRDPR